MAARVCPTCLSTVPFGSEVCPECRTSLEPHRRRRRRPILLAAVALGVFGAALLLASRRTSNFAPGLEDARDAIAPAAADARTAGPSEAMEAPLAREDTVDPVAPVAPVAPIAPAGSTEPPPETERRRSPLERVQDRSGAVLRIRTFDRDGKPFRSMAAIVVGSDNEAVTSYRYLLGAASARAEVGGAVFPVDAVLNEEARLDLVIVRVHAFPPLPSLGVERSASPRAAAGAIAPCAALGPSREPAMALGIGTLGAPLSDLESGTTRLPFHGLAASEGAALLNLDGAFLGYLPPGIESASPRFAIPAGDVAALLERPTRLPLADWNRLRFEGSASAHRRAAELDLAAGRFTAAIAELRAAIAIDPSLEPAVSAEIRDAYARWERSAREAGNLEQALRAIEESVQAFPARGDLRLRLARAYLERRRYREAIGAYAAAIAESPELEAEAYSAMADAYVRWADGLYLQGELIDALAITAEGLRAFPRAAALRLLRGRILLDRKSFADAAAELEAAARLSPGLQAQVAPLLDQARRGLGGGPIVELHFTPGSRVIPAEVVLNGRERIVMEVDTGASLTAISLLVARRLGYDTGPGARIEPVRTASGIVNAAVVTLQSVDVKGLVVRNVEAYVLELPGSSGLLGLNFLNRFQYTVEPERGVLTLRAR